MNELTGTKWKRRGSSIVWHPALLGDLITTIEPVPLRTLLGWKETDFPPSPPAIDGATGEPSATVLIGGLQTVVETMMESAAAGGQSPEVVADWLRKHILATVRRWKMHWPNVGLVFVMNGPGGLFEFNEADELVYFGRGKDRGKKVKLSAGMWNGAAASSGAYKLMVMKSDGTSSGEVGGYYVDWLS